MLNPLKRSFGRSFVNQKQIKLNSNHLMWNIDPQLLLNLYNFLYSTVTRIWKLLNYASYCATNWQMEKSKNVEEFFWIIQKKACIPNKVDHYSLYPTVWKLSGYCCLIDETFRIIMYCELETISILHQTGVFGRDRRAKPCA